MLNLKVYHVRYFSLELPTIFLPAPCLIIILPVLFCVYQISTHSLIIELQYNHVLTL